MVATEGWVQETGGALRWSLVEIVLARQPAMGKSRFMMIRYV